MTFAMLLSLVTASNAENADTLWGFIGRYRPGVTQADASAARRRWSTMRSTTSTTSCCRRRNSASRARPSARRSPTCAMRCRSSPRRRPAEKIQEVVYEVGRREPFLDQKKKAKDGKPGVALDWFDMLYQVLLGQEKGPRFGSFVSAYGLQNTIDMIDGALARSA